MNKKNYLLLKDRYQNGCDNIGRDLIRPCLEECKHYRRGTGFFSSSALKSYSDSLGRIIKDDVKIDILCSPVVQDRSFIKTLEFNASPELKKKTISMFSEKVLLMAIGYQQDPSRIDYRSKILSYLIASEQLEFKFAIPRDFDWPEEHQTNSNIYHVKMGYFEFSGGAKVAFDGSFNESVSGHSHHVDRTQVYRSWIDQDNERLKGIVEDVDYDWTEANPYIDIYPLTKDTIEIIKKHSPTKRPYPYKKPATFTTTSSIQVNLDRYKLPDTLWPHQKEAIEKFLDEKTGIIEMATGTGKTTTALEIIRQVLMLNTVSTVVISTYGTDLLNQWYEELLKWNERENESIGIVPIFRAYDKNDELQASLNFGNKKILIISREANRLYRLLNSRQLKKDKTIIVHDEIHGFGSPSLVKKLKDSHHDIVYRLGLSATPEREYDEAGSQFIESEIGPVIYNFPLERAVEANILCEFNYVSYDFELMESDRERRKNVFSRQARAAKEGKPWSEEMLYIELSKVVKKAEQKPFILDGFLQEHPETIKSSIFFVLDREQGDSICEVISRYTHQYKTYYAGTENDYLKKLADKKIDALVACERLNEGIDIKGLKSVFLIASPNSKIDTIQRIGRCLRKNPSEPSKKALVFDLILLDDNENDFQSADTRRMEWLKSISKTKNIVEGTKL